RCSADQPMLLSFWPARVEIELLIMTLVVVEHYLEQPPGRVQVRLDQARDHVSVLDAFQVAIGRTGRRSAVSLVGLGEINPMRVFFLVTVDNGISLIVIALAN